MKLSFIFELLLIFILIAFAASAAIDRKATRLSRKEVRKKHTHLNSNKKRQEPESPNRYCSCTTKLCNCCRQFNIPVVSLKGPGCASLQYLKGDKLAISMSFGDRVLTNTTVSSKKQEPVCMPLPGGVSKFCGRVYNIKRKGEDFNACLGLELRALNEVEAALRVSCFRFGPKGLKVEPSQPLPAVEDEGNDEDDEEDEDEDEDEYDGFDYGDADDDDDDEDDEDDDDDNDIDDSEYTGFSVFGDDFIDEYFTGGSSSSSGSKKKVNKKTVATTKAPVKKQATRKPALQRKPNQKVKTTSKPKQTVAKVKPQKTKTSSTTQKITSAMTTTKPSTPKYETTKASTTEKIIIMPNVKNSSENATVFDKLSAYDSIAAVTAMLQDPSSSILIKHNLASENKIAAESAPSFLSTTTQNPEIATILTTFYETPDSYTASTNFIHAETDTEESLTKLEEVTMPGTTLSNENDDEGNFKNDDSEEDDPFGEAVEDVLEEVDDSSEEVTTSVTNDKLIPLVESEKNSTKKQSEDVLDDIVDGMVDTIVGDDEGESEKRTSTDKPLESNESDEDDDDDDVFDDDDDDDDVDVDSDEDDVKESNDDETADDDDDDVDDDEDENDDDDDGGELLGRKARTKPGSRRSFQNNRQSRDMWLDRLHW